MIKKPLAEMSLKELWKRFPIVLKEHNPQYKEWYETEKQKITDHINAEDMVRINHIGSTAVKGLLAKPTVDILLEIDGRCRMARLTDDLEKLGWGMMRREDDQIRLVFNKGYTPDGYAEKVFHLHVRYAGDWDDLYFRDYLMAHSDVAKNYGQLKLNLWKNFEHDRDGYTKAKTDFVIKYSKAARQEFGNRYKLK